VSEHPSRQDRSPSRRPAWLLAAALLLIVVGCGATPATPSTSPASPGAGSPSPAASNWPSGVAQAVLNLAAADNEIRKAGVDLAAAAEQQDLGLMRGAAAGLVGVVEPNITNAQLLQTFELTRPAGDKAHEAMVGLRDAAVMIRDAIDAGDAAGIEEGSRRLAAALQVYGEARVLLSELAVEALRQVRAPLR
jgi:hypothetical protein